MARKKRERRGKGTAKKGTITASALFEFAIEYFEQSHRHRGIWAAAARHYGVTRATISYHVKRLRQLHPNHPLMEFCRSWQRHLDRHGSSDLANIKGAHCPGYLDKLRRDPYASDPRKPLMQKHLARHTRCDKAALMMFFESYWESNWTTYGMKAAAARAFRVRYPTITYHTRKIFADPELAQYADFIPHPKNVSNKRAVSNIGTVENRNKKIEFELRFTPSNRRDDARQEVALAKLEGRNPLAAVRRFNSKARERRRYFHWEFFDG